MNTVRKQCIQATRALEAACLADQLAYAALPRRSKNFWAEQPPQSWPSTPEFALWLNARRALLAAEGTLIEALRARCAAIASRRQPRRAAQPPSHAPYVEQRVDTVPDDLNGDAPPPQRAPSAPGHPGQKRGTEES